MLQQLRYVEHLAIQQAYDIKRREFTPPFGAMIGIAFSLHVLVMLIWSLMPNTQSYVMPLQELTVRLGGGDAVADAEAKAAANKKKEDAAMRRPTPNTVAPERKVATNKPMPTVKEAPRERRTAPRPTVSPGARSSLSSLAPAGPGSMYGTATGQQQVVMERYTRQLSLQVQSHAAAIRMSEALRAQAKGRRVVVELLLVVAQDGSLARISVARTSGFAELDSAAMQAARSAAPYLPPPAEYSGFGFKVAVFVD